MTRHPRDARPATRPSDGDPIAALLARFPPPPGDPELITRLRARIERDGPIQFSEFMASALYDPELGYYTARGAGIGEHGDFMTAPELNPLFGRLFATLGRLLIDETSAAQLEVVEYGPGTGALAAAFVAAWPLAARARLRYRGVEVSPPLAARQRQRLERAWPDGDWLIAAELPAPGDAVRLMIANEVLDALPVNRLVQTETGWQESRVGYSGGQFVAVPLPIADAMTARLASRLPAVATGCHTEVCPALPDWLAAASQGLPRGGLLIMDYGGAVGDLACNQRPAGTLRTFHRQTVGSNPYVRVGQQDITASVDFDLVIETALALGLQVHGPIDQGRLLGRLFAAAATPGLLQPSSATVAAEQRALHELSDPAGFGAFKAVWLSRRCDDTPTVQRLFEPSAD